MAHCRLRIRYGVEQSGAVGKKLSGIDQTLRGSGGTAGIGCGQPSLQLPNGRFRLQGEREGGRGGPIRGVLNHYLHGLALLLGGTWGRVAVATRLRFVRHRVLSRADFPPFDGTESEW